MSMAALKLCVCACMCVCARACARVRHITSHHKTITLTLNPSQSRLINHQSLPITHQSSVISYQSLFTTHHSSPLTHILSVCVYSIVYTSMYIRVNHRSVNIRGKDWSFGLPGVCGGRPIPRVGRWGVAGIVSLVCRFVNPILSKINFIGPIKCSWVLGHVSRESPSPSF